MTILKEHTEEYRNRNRNTKQKDHGSDMEAYESPGNILYKTKTVGKKIKQKH